MTKYRIPTERPTIELRKRHFEIVNRLVMKRGGWLTSIPGATTVTMECMASSILPGELADLGYKLMPDGEGQRMVPDATIEDVVTEGSSKPVYRAAHAGLIRVKKWTFTLP